MVDDGGDDYLLSCDEEIFVDVFEDILVTFQ